MDRITANEEDGLTLGEVTNGENNHLFYRPTEEKEFSEYKEKAIGLFIEEADLSRDDLEISSDENQELIEILVKEEVGVPEVNLRHKMHRVL